MYFAIKIHVLLSGVTNTISLRKERAKKKYRNNNCTHLSRSKVRPEGFQTYGNGKQLFTNEHVITTRLKCGVEEKSPRRNTHSPDWHTAAMDQTTRNCSRVLNVSLPVPICRLANKFQTNPVQEILQILHNKELNRKTFRDSSPDMHACWAVPKDSVRLQKKSNMYHSNTVDVIFGEVKMCNCPGYHVFQISKPLEKLVLGGLPHRSDKKISTCWKFLFKI